MFRSITARESVKNCSTDLWRPLPPQLMSIEPLTQRGRDLGSVRQLCSVVRAHCKPYKSRRPSRETWWTPPSGSPVAERVFRGKSPLLWFKDDLFHSRVALPRGSVAQGSITEPYLAGYLATRPS